MIAAADKKDKKLMKLQLLLLFSYSFCNLVYCEIPSAAKLARYRQVMSIKNYEI